jgi:membrane associated rhomboid family serine protease
MVIMKQKDVILGATNNVATQLLVIQIAIFILLYFIKIIYQMESYGLVAFDQDILQYIAVPGKMELFISKFWTVFTAPFINLDFWQMLTSGIWLYIFGYGFLKEDKGAVIVPLFLLGSWMGLVCFAFSSWLHADEVVRFAIGPEAGIMALAVSAALLKIKIHPLPLIFKNGISMAFLSVLYMIIQVFNSYMRGVLEWHAYIAGGALLGLLFSIQYLKGKDWSGVINKPLHFIGNIFAPKS